LHQNPKPPVPPLLILVIGMIAASTAGVLIRFAQREADSLVISAVRLMIAVLVLSPLALFRYRKEMGRLRGEDLKLSFLAGIFLALHFAGWISSLQFTSVASSVVLVASTPLWVALAAPIILRETLPQPVKIGMIVALFGGVLVGLSTACQLSFSGVSCEGFAAFFQGNAFLGNVLALGGAITGAGYLLVGRKISGKYPLVVYIFYVYGSAAAILLAVVLFLGLPLTGFTIETYGFLVALALIPQLLGHSSYNWALKYLPVAYVSVVLLAEPIGSTTLAYLFLNEPPTILEIIGGGVILSGIYIASRSPSPSS